VRLRYHFGFAAGNDVMRLCLSASLLALALVAPASAAIVDSATERALSLPGSNFKIVIPREDWLITREQTRTDVKSVYYALGSAKRDMTLWLFIDQTPVCQSAKACLELALKNKAYDDAKDMRFSEQDGFNIVQFTLEPAKDGVKQRHLIAATYVDGAWIDVHFFQTIKLKTNPEAVFNALKLISIK
jgi:hypothetical protein